MARHHRKSRLVKKRGRKLGAAPGTLVHIGEAPDNGQLDIQLLRYGRQTLDEKRVSVAGVCGQQMQPGLVCWINIDGVHDAEAVQAVGEKFGLHPLVMEDIVNTDHRPKIENHADYLYIVLKMLQYDEAQQNITIEQVSLVVGETFVLSFQERAGDVFDGVRQRLRTGRRIRDKSSDYLMYALMDAVVDNYFSLLEKLSDRVESLEDELINTPTPATLAHIHHFKREMLLLRKAVWPLREMLSSMAREESPLIHADTRLFLRDIYDHTIHIMDTIDTLRDLLAGMLDLYVSSISNRTNQVMKVLTIFASVFMPLTFIAGVYGMNFEHMPELTWFWAYPATLLAMAAIGAGLLTFFKWKKWF